MSSIDKDDEYTFTSHTVTLVLNATADQVIRTLESIMILVDPRYVLLDEYEDSGGGQYNKECPRLDTALAEFKNFLEEHHGMLRQADPAQYGTLRGTLQAKLKSEIFNVILIAAMYLSDMHLNPHGHKDKYFSALSLMEAVDAFVDFTVELFIRSHPTFTT
jgi:hypothetical protein